MTTYFLLGDFNVSVEDTSAKNFCRSYNLISTINKPKIYKNPDRTSCTDLILTSCPQSFQNSFFLKNRSEENNINYNKQTCVLHFWEKVKQNITKI